MRTNFAVDGVEKKKETFGGTPRDGFRKYLGPIQHPLQLQLSKNVRHAIDHAVARFNTFTPKAALCRSHLEKCGGGDE